MRVAGIISALDVLRVFGGTDLKRTPRTKAAGKPRAKARPKMKARTPRKRRAA
jgi:hypothetical protein